MSLQRFVNLQLEARLLGDKKQTTEVMYVKCKWVKLDTVSKTAVWTLWYVSNNKYGDSA